MEVLNGTITLQLKPDAAINKYWKKKSEVGLWAELNFTGPLVPSQLVPR